MPEKISPYLKFAMKYCDHKGYFTVNPTTKKREYEGFDLLDGMLVMHEHLNKNRKGKKNEQLTSV